MSDKNLVEVLDTLESMVRQYAFETGKMHMRRYPIYSDYGISAIEEAVSIIAKFGRVKIMRNTMNFVFLGDSE